MSDLEDQLEKSRKLVYTGYKRGYLAGLRRSYEIAKDYTGQGVCILAEIVREIEKQ